jgi:hypothetical protein
MSGSEIKRGMIVTPRYVLSTSGGYVRGPGMAIRGYCLKVIRAPTKTRDGVRCELLPRDEDNGPVYVDTFPSQLVPLSNRFEPLPRTISARFASTCDRRRVTGDGLRGQMAERTRNRRPHENPQRNRPCNSFVQERDALAVQFAAYMQDLQPKEGSTT